MLLTRYRSSLWFPLPKYAKQTRYNEVQVPQPRTNCISFYSLLAGCLSFCCLCWSESECPGNGCKQAHPSLLLLCPGANLVRQDERQDIFPPPRVAVAPAQGGPRPRRVVFVGTPAAGFSPFHLAVSDCAFCTNARFASAFLPSDSDSVHFRRLVRPVVPLCEFQRRASFLLPLHLVDGLAGSCGLLLQRR